MVVTDIAVCQDRLVFHVGDVVRKLRIQRGLKLEELAERAQMSKTTLSGIERGEGNPRTDTLERIASALGVSLFELHRTYQLYNRPPAPAHEVDDEALDVSDYTKADVPVLAEGEASPDGMFWTDEGKPTAQVEEWMSRPGDVREKAAYAIVVRGDSMEPMLKRGYRIILSQVRPVQDGDIVYAQLKSGERLVKVAHKQKGGYVLESYNQAYPPRFVATDELTAIHKCVYIRTIN